MLRLRNNGRERPGEALDSREVVATLQLALRENAVAAAAFIFLVSIAVSKTLLTKLVFIKIDTPVAYSALSCLVTNVCMIPIFLVQPSTFQPIQRHMLRGFGFACVAIACDLAFANVALALLSVALQQCIRSLSPAATLFVEQIVQCKRQPVVLWVVVILLCFGPFLVTMGSSEWDVSTFGVIMMVLSVLAGAFKYVLAHAVLTTYKKELGTLSYLFWVECFVFLLLLPFAIGNGEVGLMIFAERPFGDWVLLLFTAAYGGVRVYSQFLFLAHTSATSLALSNLLTQALTIILGIFFFNTEVTTFLVLGVLITLLMSVVYTYVKLVHIPAMQARDSLASADGAEAAKLDEVVDDASEGKSGESEETQSRSN